MGKRVLLQNGLVITFIHEGYHSIKMKYADILIEDGKFSKISEQITPESVGECEVHDLKGRWILPGFVNAGGRCTAAKLLHGILPDYSRHNWRGSMFYHRTAPILRIADRVLNEEEKECLAHWALRDAVTSGTTTLVEIAPHGFAEAIARAASDWKLRTVVVDLASESELPEAEQNGMLCKSEQGEYAFTQKRMSGSAQIIPGLFSLECTSEAQFAQAKAFCQENPLLLFAGHSKYEEQTSWNRYGKSPVGVLKDQGLLTENTILLDSVYTDFFDRERLRTAGSNVAISAVGAMQDAVAFPAVTMLRQNINTAVCTGWYGCNMMEEMKAACYGAKLDTGVAQQYQASDAFYAATIAPSQALHMPTGRIDVGFNADLIVVDPTRLAPHNYPLIEFVYDAQRSDLESVMVNGEWIWDAKKADPEQVNNYANAVENIAKKVWGEARKTVL